MKRLAGIKQLVGNEEKSSQPTRLVRCIMGSSTNNPYPISIRVGERYPADHDYVKRWPWAFIDDSLPDYVGRDVRQKYQVAEEARGQAIADQTEGKRGVELEKQEALRQSRIIPLERQRLCIAAAGAWGASAPLANWKKGEPMGIRAGELADAKWSLVREFPGRFVRILPEGLAVENALVCVADEGIIQRGADGGVARRIYRGQMVDKDDPLVEINPTMFLAASVAGQVAGSTRELIVTARADQIISDSQGPAKASGYVSE